MTLLINIIVANMHAQRQKQVESYINRKTLFYYEHYYRT